MKQLEYVMAKINRLTKKRELFNFLIIIFIFLKYFIEKIVNLLIFNAKWLIVFWILD